MDANQIIDALDGTSAVAALCEVKPASVSEWRKVGIPRARLMYLKAVRPDVFAPVGADDTPSPVLESTREAA